MFRTVTVRAEDVTTPEPEQRKAESYVKMIVTDSGHGMDEATASQIFEPFYTTKEENKGTGLGLSTVYGIVKQNSGFINVKSKEGIGTTFEIYFPQITGESKDSQEPDTQDFNDIGGNERILLVEDDEPVRTLIKKILTKYGYAVTTMNNGNDALRAIQDDQLQFDLLLTDIVMPGMNGIELAKRVLEVDKDKKILFMSGHNDEIINARGLLDEGVNFTFKPFQPKEIAAMIRKTIDSI